MQGDFTIGELKNVPTRGRHKAQIGVTVDPRGQVSPLPAPVRQYLGDQLVPDLHGTMYTVYTMKKKGPEPHSAVLTIRVPRTLDRKLTREARRLRRTRSATARTLLEGALEGTPDGDPIAEARRQSRLASRQASEADVLEFITTAADLRGWK